MSKNIEVIDFYDTDTLSNEIDSCNTYEELEKLYETKLAEKTLNVVDIVIIEELFGKRMEDLRIDFSYFEENDPTCSEKTTPEEKK